MNSKKTTLAAVCLFFYTLIIPQDAFAYLDPASLSMFAQILVAGVVGGFMFFKGGVTSVKNFVLKLFKKSPKP